MFGQKQTRALLGPADPARNVAVAPARLSAQDLMTRAGSTESTAATESTTAIEPTAVTEPTAATSTGLVRRRVLVGVGAVATAGVAAAAVGAYALVAPATDQPPGGETPHPRGAVVVPIAYEVATDPPPAGDHLRDLAGRITDAPYDGGSGQYAYHRYQTWGGTVAGVSPEGHEMSYVEEFETWTASDGSGRHRQTTLGAEFPDAESERYFEERGLPGPPEPLTSDLPAGFLHPGTPPPADPEQLAALLGVDPGDGEPYAVKPLPALYQRYVVPRQVRAAALEVLADVPGLKWRGEVTDRAGRTGVAVTSEANGLEQVLVFDPGTGELLAHELVDERPDDPGIPFRVQAYALLLETGWTDTLG